MSIGPLKHAGIVERAAVARLRARMPAYTAEAAAQDAVLTGGDPLALPDLRGVIRVSELARWPEQQLPLAAVISAGTATEPERDGEGMYRAAWSLSVAVLVASAEEEGSRDLAHLYGAAVRGCLLQDRSLGGAVRVTGWLGESLDDLPVAQRRTMFGHLNLFAVQLDDVVSWQGTLNEGWEAETATVTVNPSEDP